jgi:hypothetical protein
VSSRNPISPGVKALEIGFLLVKSKQYFIEENYPKCPKKTKKFVLPLSVWVTVPQPWYKAYSITKTPTMTLKFRD